MIDLKKIRATTMISPEVKKFMEGNGGNHVNLYRGWYDEPRMKEEIDLLEQQLAHAIRSGRYPVAKRLLGRLRTVNAVKENEDLDRIMGKAPEDQTVTALGCLG